MVPSDVKRGYEKITGRDSGMGGKARCLKARRTRPQSVVFLWIMKDGRTRA